jgi:hypothetical protein
MLELEVIFALVRKPHPCPVRPTRFETLRLGGEVTNTRPMTSPYQMGNVDEGSSTNSKFRREGIMKWFHRKSQCSVRLTNQPSRTL